MFGSEPDKEERLVAIVESIKLWKQKRRRLKPLLRARIYSFYENELYIRRNNKNHYIDVSRNSCPLCDRWYSLDCVCCPICSYTGKQRCHDTPHKKIVEYLLTVSYVRKHLLELFDEEINFLELLLKVESESSDQEEQSTEN